MFARTVATEFTRADWLQIQFCVSQKYTNPATFPSTKAEQRYRIKQVPMNAFGLFWSWLPPIEVIIAIMVQIISWLSARESDTNESAESVTLTNHKNKQYRNWETEINSIVRDTTLSISLDTSYSRRAMDAIIRVVQRSLGSFLASLLRQAEREDINLKMLSQLRDGVNDASLNEPRFWMNGVFMLIKDIQALRSRPLDYWAERLPHGAEQHLNIFFENLFRSVDGRLAALRTLYEDNYQGAWVTFYIRFRFGFSKLRAWGKLIVSSGTLVYLTTVGLEYILSISENYPRLAERIKFYVALALLLFTVLAYSTGLTWYFVSCLLSGTSGLKEFFMNKKSSDKTKKSWLSDIYGKSFTWCFWWHGKLEDPSLQANVYNETACELWEEIPLKDQSSINPADDERGLRTGSNNLSASIYWTPLEDMNPASAMRVARIY